MRKGWTLRLSMLLVCILMVFPIDVWADEKSYHVSEADFDITINDDGSAKVIESWTVDFEGNSFTRFYRDISIDVPKDEDFGRIEELQVSIDGIPCELTDHPSQSPDGTYFFDRVGDSYRISAFRTSTSVTEYVFSYELTNVVKNIDNEYDLFIFRPISADFEKSVEQLKVHFHSPVGSTPQVLYCTKGDSVISGSDAEIFAEDCKGMYRIRIRMDGADIPGATYSETKDLSKKESLIMRILDRFNSRLGGYLLFFLLFEGFRLLMKYWGMFTEKKKYRRFQKDPKWFDQNLQIIKAHLKPVELALFMTDFYLYEFACLVQLGKIRLDARNFWLTKDPEGLDGYAKDYYSFVLGHIRSRSDTKHKDGWYYVDYEAYGLYLEDDYESVVGRRLILRNRCEEILMERKDYRRIRSAYKVVEDYGCLMCENKRLYDIIKDEKDPYMLAVLIALRGVSHETIQGSGDEDYIHYYTDELSKYTWNAYRKYGEAHSS